MSIHIAALTAGDYAEVRRLWESTPGMGLSYCDSEKFFAPYLERNPGLSLVARDGNAIVAAVMCGHDGRRGYLSHLAVAAGYRYRGLGRRLVETCLQKLWTAGVTACNIRVYRDNAAGIAFWERIGFRDVGVNVMRRDIVMPGKEGAPDEVRLPALSDDDYLDPVPTIRVNDEIVLTPFDWTDQPELIRLLNATTWYSQQMPLIPHPYTAENARSWVTRCMLQTYDGEQSRGWAIRQAGEFIGGIGLSDIKASGSHEMGYWLAQSQWGQGIMPAVVRSLTAFAFREYPIEKLFARVFHTNPASARVLEKAGYTLEGTLRRHLVHQDVPRDVLYYGMLSSEAG
jgi:N-acetylglutamate synthase